MAFLINKNSVKLIWLPFILACLSSVVSADGAREYEVKAAFLINFARYVEWPDSSFESADSPLVIGIVGRDPLGVSLDAAAKGKTISGHPIAIHRLHWGDNLKTCQIIFIASTEREKMNALISGTRGAPILLVGEHAGFARKGGMIGFYMEQDRVRFEINVEMIKKEKLTASSRLLGLAKIVG